MDFSLSSRDTSRGRRQWRARAAMLNEPCYFQSSFVDQQFSRDRVRTLQDGRDMQSGKSFVSPRFDKKKAVVLMIGTTLGVWTCPLTDDATVSTDRPLDRVVGQLLRPTGVSAFDRSFDRLKGLGRA